MRVDHTCPHCTKAINLNFHSTVLWQKNTIQWIFDVGQCPSCQGAMIYLTKRDCLDVLFLEEDDKLDELHRHVPAHKSARLIYPVGSNRPPIDAEIPRTMYDDYQEACAVLPISQKASAALSRRCLQNILRNELNVKPTSLANEIDQAVKAHSLSPQIERALDAVKEIGNFAAHPGSDIKTGEIVDVDDGEAEWSLEILEMFFEHVYARPQRDEARLQKLHKKLVAAGRRKPNSDASEQ